MVRGSGDYHNKHKGKSNADPIISSGFFSVIWRGRWQGQDVAIKELNPTTDRDLFIKEVEVWRQLRNSDFVLPFLGASSTTGPPPWFFISPYSEHTGCWNKVSADGHTVENGNVLAYLRSDTGSHSNKYVLVHQMAQGLEYLHSRDIVHGDFKVRSRQIFSSELTDLKTDLHQTFSHLRTPIHLIRQRTFS